MAVSLLPFLGSFSVAFAATPNPGNLTCGGTPLPPLASAAEAHGVGASTLGFLSFEVEKTLSVPGKCTGASQ